MKTRGRTSVAASPSSSPSRSFYKYLKPGELAKLRYSKITARSKQIGAQNLLALSQLKSSPDSVLPQPHFNDLPIDVIPCFNKRVQSNPRCLGRKKLSAGPPVFSETYPNFF